MSVRLRKDRGIWQVDWRGSNRQKNAKVFKTKKEAETFDAFIKLQRKHDPSRLDSAIEEELARMQGGSSSPEKVVPQKPRTKVASAAQPKPTSTPANSGTTPSSPARKGRRRPKKNSLPVEEPPSPFATLETVAMAYLKDRQFTKEKSYSHFLGSMKIPLELFRDKS